MTIVARDSGNILLPQYAEAIHRLDLFIRERVHVQWQGRTWKYSDLCLQWKNQGCPGNKHVQLISDVFNHGLNLTYPTFRLGGRCVLPRQ